MEWLATKRKSGARDESAAVVSRGSALLKGGLSRPDAASVREQVFLAALDTHELESAGAALAKLDAAFPESQRVARLKGLHLEARGENKAAAAIYEEMAETNMVRYKRQVSLLKASGRLPEAIALLVKYLEKFPGDKEGWKELALLYAEAGSMKRACFCLEEVLIADPHSYISRMAYAEALATLGNTATNVLDARRYFALSLKAKKPEANARALWGIVVTSKALDDCLKQAPPAKDKSLVTAKEMRRGAKTTVHDVVAADENAALNAKAREHLAKAALPDGMKEIVDAALARLAC